MLRIGIGLFGSIGPLGLAMATAQAPREETGRAVGLIQAAQILSAAIGPFAGGVLADAIGIRRTFLVTAALCALALVLVLAFYEERGRRGEEGRRAGPGLPRRRRPSRRCRPAVVLFVVNFIGRSFTPILPLHLGLLGIPSRRLASATGVLICRLLGGRGRVRVVPRPAEPDAVAPGPAAAHPRGRRGRRWHRWLSCRASS